MTKQSPPVPKSQRGAVLFVSLLLLLVLTLIGVAAARLQTGEEQMARNDDNHQLALQSAEAALRHAETNLWDGIYSAGDFASNENGTYDLPTELNDAGSIVDSSGWTSSAITYNGPALSNVPAPPAQFVIESLPPVARPGDPICSGMYGGESTCAISRITAHATGGDQSAQVTLQSIFH